MFAFRDRPPPTCCGELFVVPDSFKGQLWRCPYSGWTLRLPDHIPDGSNLKEEEWLAFEEPGILLGYFVCLNLNQKVTERKEKLVEAALHSRRGFWARLLPLNRNARPEEKKLMCQLIHEVFGSPFHPVTVNPDWLSWNEGTIPQMARTIFEKGSFDELPILADALEEAGCQEEYLLSHCRQPQDHIRGCWAVDLLLGRHLALRT